MSKNDGGPAFPQEYQTGMATCEPGSSPKPEKMLMGGMSLRDYLAGQALPGVMNRMHEDIQHLGSPTFPANVANHSYAIADSMLAARKDG